MEDEELAGTKSDLVPFHDIQIHTKEDPYEVSIDMDSDYESSLGQTGYYDKPVGMRLGEVLQLGIMMCRVLEALISRNLYHRYIQPDAVLVKENGKFKLGQPLLSRRGPERADGYSRRERSYMAPELFWKSENYSTIHFEHIDEKTELYSVGAVLYEILDHNHGIFIEEVSSEEEAENRRLSGEIPPCPDTGTRRLGKCIQKACSPRDKRYADFAEFRRDLEEIEKSLPAEWKQGSIFQSCYDDTEIRENPNPPEEKVIPKKESIPEEKPEETMIPLPATEKAEEPVKYEELSEEGLEREEGRTKKMLIGILVGVAVLIGGTFLLFGNQKQYKIKQMIENGTYAIAIKEIAELNESGKNTDKLCMTYIDACISDNEIKRIPDAVALMTVEVPIEYYQKVLDSVLQSGRERVYYQVLSLIEKKVDNTQ